MVKLVPFFIGADRMETGDQNIRLDEAEKWVPEALVEARAASKDELIKKSGVDV